MSISHRIWYDVSPDASGNLVRTARIPDTEPETSRYRHVVLSQARVERFLLDNMKANNGLLVERAVEPGSLSIDINLIDSPDAHPVTVTVQHLPQETVSEDEVANTNGPESGLYRSNLFADDAEDAVPQQRQQAGQNETIKAKYVVGCDGARSWTRKQIGYELEGENSSTYWGVMDARVLTDFPVCHQLATERRPALSLPFYCRIYASRSLFTQHRTDPFLLSQENATSSAFIFRWAP